MSKTRKNLSFVAVLLVMLMLVWPMAVSAAQGNTFYKFYFDEKGVDKPCDEFATKRDDEQNWYLSIYRTNPYTGASSTMSSTNVFLARMNKYGDHVSGTNHNFVSAEHTISNYPAAGTSFRFPYVYLVDTEMTLFLGGRKTVGSTSTTPLVVCGKYCP